MVEQLQKIRDICAKYADHSSVRLLDRLLALHELDASAFWDLLTSNEVWGGAGSLADQCLVAPSVSTGTQFEHDRRMVWEALAGIADEMKAGGLLNERTLFWASTFSSWARP